MSESAILRRVWLSASALAGVVLFRNNTGTGWAGKLISKIGGAKNYTVMIEAARPLHAGLHKGSSDLVGWRSIVVTPQMVGHRLAVFTAIEVKAPRGRIRAGQQNFMQQVQQAGGIAGVVRSPADAEALLLDHPRPGGYTGGPAGGA
jgi:hypothetical protein